jgi:predicted AlkP superfamily phosphohydrolase/phosphomutase
MKAELRQSVRRRHLVLGLQVCLIALLAVTSCGKPKTASRVFVIGLDGATFDLLQPWLDKGELPNLKGLLTGGVYGELRSIYPILSPVAWTSMFTGVNPGKHGIFDFEYPDPQVPGKQLLYTAEQRRAVPIWELLGDAGKTVGVLNIPMTWPPDHVNGVMVSGFPFPDKADLEYTYPADLKTKLGAYPLDKMGEGIVKGAEAAKLAEIVESRDAVQRVLLDWMKTRHDDFTWAVFTATDRIQHFFWGMMDPKHPYYTAELGRNFGDSIHEFWLAMDQRLGEIVASLPKDATILIVSDHGFGPIYREVNTFNWFDSTPLIQYVKTHQVPDLYITNGIFRYRLGTTYPMSPEYDKFVDLFTHEAVNLTDPATGGHPIEKVMKRSDLYVGRQLEKAPDLVMIEAPECYIGTGDRNQKLDPVTDLHSTSYSAYHRPNGIFIIKGPNVRTGELQGASLLDVTPTVLYIMGQPVPSEMDGRILTAVFTPEWVKAHPPQYTDGTRILKDAPERVLSAQEREELQAVPYIK